MDSGHKYNGVDAAALRKPMQRKDSIMKEVKETISLNAEGSAIVTIDQTLLPAEEKTIELRSKEDVWNAIKTMKIRGAPAIGICAAYGIYIALRDFPEKDAETEDFYGEFKKVKAYLASARPTAVNLFWALDQMEKEMLANKELPVREVKKALLSKAEQMKAADIKTCRMIGEYSLEVLRDGDGILTHCNAGRLAAVKYGTALSGIYLGNEKGLKFKVYADETRPLFQGARLTVYELQKAGIDVTLICDNMASSVMQKGLINAVVTGADRIAANGDTANKIGTSGLAIMAKHYNIPFYVCAPLSTVDMECLSGKDIIIEERKPDEVTDNWFKRQIAPQNTTVLNPAFDVTDSALISGIITEKGIAYPPFKKTIKDLKNSI